MYTWAAVRILPYLRKEKRPKLVSFHGVDTRDDFLEENIFWDV